MPDFEHPGFTYWPGNHPGFPIGEIAKFGSDHVSCWAEASFTLPQNPAHAKIAAVRFAGFPGSGKLWFAVECITDAAGILVCEWVLRGQHLRWFEDHGESGPGPVMEMRLNQATMFGWGSHDTLAEHGPHCDLMRAIWGLNQGRVNCYLSVTHQILSLREYEAEQEKAAREIEKGVYELPKPKPELPPEPAEPPPPLPEPEPNPGDGA